MAAAPFYNNVMETSTTTGTGTLTLAGAVTGYQSFAAIGNGNTTPMAIWEVDANGNPSGAWEVATVCTYTAATPSLTRGTLDSSSTGSVINFAAGTKRVAQALPAAILNTLMTGIGGVVTSGTAGSILYVGAGPVLAQDNANLKWGTTAGQGLTLGAGTAVTAVSPLAITQTINNAAILFPGLTLTYIATAYAANSVALKILGGAAGATGLFTVLQSGNAGLGTTTPLTLLHLNNGSHTYAKIQTTSSGTDAGVDFTSPTGRWFIGQLDGSSTAADFHIFDVNLGLVSLIVKGTTGNVGVGTLIPATQFAIGMANGQQTGIHELSELLTIAAAATSTTTIQKPAGSIIIGVSVRVTTAITCTSVFEVGDSTSANRFNTASVSKAATTTNAGTKAAAYYNATAEGIIITPDTTPSDATGRVRVTISYMLITPATS